MANGDVPIYRVRLFLSVDLTGSTSFKSNHGSFVWLKAFQEFYSQFPEIFAVCYSRTCANIPGLAADARARVPKIWKTIGDEILFVNRVESVTHLGAYVTAFALALREFGHQMSSNYRLNTKGNGWIAAFPSPNCSIRVRSLEGEDPLSGLSELTTEEFEVDVDEHPENYDFLGKGIDSGFRIARNSSVDTFTISPALAFLLVKAKSNPDATRFDSQLIFHEPQSFKGVVDGLPYPVISIDTVRTPDQRTLKQIEARLLQKPAFVEQINDLREYLATYLRFYRIEEPCLKLSSGDADEKLPEHYEKYVLQWNAESEKAASDLASLTQEIANEEGGEPVPSVEEVVEDFEVDKTSN